MTNDWCLAIVAALLLVGYSHCDVPCRNSSNVCQEILRIDLVGFYAQAYQAQIELSELSATCRLWSSCINAMRYDHCSFDDMDHAYWYWHSNGNVSADTLNYTLNYMCDTLPANYSTYHSCFNSDDFGNSYWKARCEATVVAKQYAPYYQFHVTEPLDEDSFFTHLAQYASCFYASVKLLCGGEIARNVMTYFIKHVELAFGNLCCSNHVTEIVRWIHYSTSRDIMDMLKIVSIITPDQPASCNVDNVLHCSYEMPQMSHAYSIFLYSTYNSNANSQTFCSNWTRFLSCTNTSGCSMADIARIVESNIDFIGFHSIEKYYSVLEINSTFNSFSYLCNDGQDLMATQCGLVVDDIIACDSLRYLRTLHPYFQLFGTCRMLLMDAVCMYNTVSSLSCGQATVELWMKFSQLWWWWRNWHWWAYPAVQEQCELNYSDVVRTAASSDMAGPCSEEKFIQCLDNSSLRNVLYNDDIGDYLFGGLRGVSWFNSMCRSGIALLECLQCNDSSLLDKIDFVSAYADHDFSNSWNLDRSLADRIVRASGALTPKRMILLCHSDREEMLKYQKCFGVIGGFNGVLHECLTKLHVNISSDLHQNNCSNLRSAFDCLRSAIAKSCSTNVAIFVLKYIMEEWTSYLRKCRCPSGRPETLSRARSDCLSEGDEYIELVCHFAYNGSGSIPLHMTWSLSDGRTFEDDVSNSSSTGLYQSSLLVSPKIVKLCSCTLSLTVVNSSRATNNASSCMNTATTQVNHFGIECPNSARPVVVDIYPTRHLITGGTSVFIYGRNFHMVRTALLIVTTVYSSQDNRGSKNITEFVSQPCTFNNDTLVTCVIPTLILPEEFKNLTDSNLVSSQWGQRRDSGLDFYETVVFNHTYERHLSSSLQFIKSTQSLTPSGLQIFDPSAPVLITIKGVNFLNGVTLSADYTVLIGDGQCQPVGQLTDNLFYCQAPMTRPNKTTGFCQDDFALLVEVGNRNVKLGFAGCLRYAVNADDTRRLVIIIVCTVGGSFLLITAGVLIGVCARRRNNARPTSSTTVGSEHNVDDTSVERLRPEENNNDEQSNPDDDSYTKHVSNLDIEMTTT